MSCSAIAALVGAVVVYSYNYDNDFRLSDAYVIAPHEEAYAQVCYYNNEYQSSLPGITRLEFNDLSVVINTDIGSSIDDDEVITITPSLGFVVEPDTSIKVKDGDSHTFLIYFVAF